MDNKGNHLSQSSCDMDTTHGAKKNKAVITVDENMLRNHVAEVVRQNLEETLNGLLDAEADELCYARKYERNSYRASTRAGHYEGSVQKTSGKVNLKVPKLRNIPGSIRSSNSSIKLVSYK